MGGEGQRDFFFLLILAISFFFGFCLFCFIYKYTCIFWFVFLVWLASMRLSHVVQESFEVRDIIKDGGKG